MTSTCSSSSLPSSVLLILRQTNQHLTLSGFFFIIWRETEIPLWSYLYIHIALKLLLIMTKIYIKCIVISAWMILGWWWCGGGVPVYDFSVGPAHTAQCSQWACVCVSGAGLVTAPHWVGVQREILTRVHETGNTGDPVYTDQLLRWWSQCQLRSGSQAGHSCSTDHVISTQQHKISDKQ